MSDFNDFAIHVLSNVDSVQLPPVIKKNLMESFSRLVGGIVGWPVAYLDSRTQQIKSEADALSLITKTASEAVAEEFKTDKYLINRSVEYFGKKLLGAQVNRENIVRLAVEDLKSDLPKEDVENEIDIDWLDMFSRISETKSNEDVQLFLSKILAGEIRSPGTFSQRTLHTLSLLDQTTAKIFQTFCNVSFQFINSPDITFLIADPLGIPGTNELQSVGLSYSNLSKLQDAGLIQYSLDTTRPFEALALEIPFKVGNEAFTFKRKPDTPSEEIRINTVNYTQTGIELKKVIHHSSDSIYSSKFVEWAENEFKLELIK